MLWCGLVSRVGASHTVNLELIAPFPRGQNCPRKVAMFMSFIMVAPCVRLRLTQIFQSGVPGLSKRKNSYRNERRQEIFIG